MIGHELESRKTPSPAGRLARATATFGLAVSALSFAAGCDPGVGAESPAEETAQGESLEPLAVSETNVSQEAAVSALVNNAICHDNSYGGNWFCAYGHHSFNLPDGTNQFFVIGPDFAVWTRWRKNGIYSRWVSMGGRIRASFNASDFSLGSCDVQPMLWVMGTDNHWYADIRRSSGAWSGWDRDYRVPCTF